MESSEPNVKTRLAKSSMERTKKASKIPLLDHSKSTQGIQSSFESLKYARTRSKLSTPFGDPSRVCKLAQHGSNSSVSSINQNESNSSVSSISQAPFYQLHLSLLVHGLLTRLRPKSQSPQKAQARGLNHPASLTVLKKPRPVHIASASTFSISEAFLGEEQFMSSEREKL